jgi:hypothetical protein
LSIQWEIELANGPGLVDLLKENTTPPSRPDKGNAELVLIGLATSDQNLQTED